MSALPRCRAAALPRWREADAHCCHTDRPRRQIEAGGAAGRRIGRQAGSLESGRALR